MAKGISTGTKVMLGVGVLAAAGIGFYFWKRGQPAVDEPTYGTDSVAISRRMPTRYNPSTPVYTTPGAGMQAQRKTPFTGDDAVLVYGAGLGN